MATGLNNLNTVQEEVWLLSADSHSDVSVLCLMTRLLKLFLSSDSTCSTCPGWFSEFSSNVSGFCSTFDEVIPWLSGFCSTFDEVMPWLLGSCSTFDEVLGSCSTFDEVMPWLLGSCSTFDEVMPWLLGSCSTPFFVVSLSPSPTTSGFFWSSEACSVLSGWCSTTSALSLSLLSNHWNLNAIAL